MVQVSASYIDFPSIVKKIMIDIETNVFMTFEPKEETIEIDGKPAIRKFAEVCYVDETIPYSNSFEMDNNDIRQLITALQRLQNQITTENKPSNDGSNTCGRKVYIK